MDISKVLNELDSLYREHRLVEIEPFLKSKTDEARRLKDYDSLITLLNEAIGYYRDRFRFKECNACCTELLQLFSDMDLKDSRAYATTLLNIATAYRAENRPDEAMGLYEEVKRIYKLRLDPADYLYAALYNNISLLYEQQGDYKKAAENLEKALDIVSAYPEEKASLATSHCNLAKVLLETEHWEEAVMHLEKALRLYSELDRTDAHYSMLLSCLGDYFYRKKEYGAAAKAIKEAMAELEYFTGRTDAYYQLEKKLRKIESLSP